MAGHVLEEVRVTEPQTVICDEPRLTSVCAGVALSAGGRVYERRHPGLSSSSIGDAGRARRRIPPVSGHALEKLGHAIEYLIDEYSHQGYKDKEARSQVAAIQILMELNREVYYDCPMALPLSKRIGEFLRAAIN